LLRLAPQFPRDFIRNPVVDWLLIEEPDLLQQLGKGVLRNVLKHSGCPPSMIGWAVRHGSVEHQLAVTANPAAEAIEIAALARRKGPIRRAARAHVSCPKQLQASASGATYFIEAISDALAALPDEDALSFWRRGLLGPSQWLALNAPSRAAVLGLDFPLAQRRQPDSRGCRVLAKSPDTPPAILTQLSSHRDRHVRSAVANHPNPPETVAARLAKDKDEWVARAVAQNPATPVSVLVSLARHADRFVVSEVARNPSTPAVTLLALSRNKKLDVCSYVAGNRNAPAELLEAFARASDRYLRREVADNPGTSAELLGLLATDPDEWVRESVASNPNTAAEHLAMLACDPEYGVRYRVARNPKSSPNSDLSAAKPATVRPVRVPGTRSARRFQLAADPDTSPEVLSKLARSGGLAVRWTLVANPNTPEALRRELVVELACALGFDGLPVGARELAEQERDRVLLTMDARHWWHKLQLACRRYGHRGLPAQLADGELIERLLCEIRVFEAEPQKSLAATILGIGQRPLFYIPTPRLGKALRLSLYHPRTPEECLLFGVPRLFALAHANAPPEWPVKATGSINWLERMAVARNVNVAPRLLAVLKRDANRFVAAQAEETETLQRYLEDWPRLAIAIRDQWEMLQLGIAEGIAQWDGFSGETRDLIERVRRHRQLLQTLACEPASVPEAAQ
jgi:hypothetical protein